MALFDKVGKITKGLPLIGGMFESPDVSIVPLDKETKGLISSGAQRVMAETPESISQQITQGVEQGVNALSPSANFIAQESSRTGQDPYMMSAIQNRFRQNVSGDLKRFKSQADLQAKLLKGQRMADISSSVMAGQQVQLNNFAALSQAFQANEAARAQVISGFIGLGSALHTANVAGAGSPARTARTMATQSQNQFATQQPIGGNMNPFGMSEGYGQF